MAEDSSLGCVRTMFNYPVTIIDPQQLRFMHLCEGNIQCRAQGKSCKEVPKVLQHGSLNSIKERCFNQLKPTESSQLHRKLMKVSDQIIRHTRQMMSVK